MTLTLAATHAPTTHAPTLTTTVGALLEQLGAVGVAIATRPPVPILGGVVLDVLDGAPTLSATDYETSVRVHTDGAGTDGRAVLSHAALLKVVKAATKGDTPTVYRAMPVQITTRHNGDDTEAEVTVGGFTVPVHAFRRADYPALPAAHAQDTVSLPVETLARMLSRVLVSAGHDDTLPMLTGVRVELSGGRLTFATTDRFRLGVASELVDSDGTEGGWLIPAKTLAAVVKRLPAYATAHLGMTDAGWVTVTAGPVVATVRTLDGEFPRFRQLFPDAPTTVAIVERAALVKVVNRAAALGAAIGNRIETLRVTVGDDGFTVAPHLTEDADRVKGASVAGMTEGDPVTFGCNGKYFAEALDTFTGDMVALGWTSPNRPVILAADPADLADNTATYRHLLMPTRLAV